MDEDEHATDGGYITDGNSLGLALPSPRPTKSQQQTSSLEVLLATKNKRITEELTKLRVRALLFLIPSSLIINFK